VPRPVSWDRAGCGWWPTRWGFSPDTVRRGRDELDDPQPLRVGRSRAPGGGRKRAEERDPGLGAALDKLVDPASRGDPMTPLRWTCRSLRTLSARLRDQGHQACPTLVGRLLHEAGYSLQANAKTLEGNQNPDRDAQFQHIHDTAAEFLAGGDPVISIDCKKKELVGQFDNGGTRWRPKGRPEQVNVHDFLDPQLGKAIPYGIYDIGANTGWVSVGVDHETAAFAAAAASAPPANCSVCTPSTSSSVLGDSTRAVFSRAVSPSIVIQDDGIAACNPRSDTAWLLPRVRCTRCPAETESIDVGRTITSRFGCPSRAHVRFACWAAAACCAACLAARRAASSAARCAALACAAANAACCWAANAACC
jgi:DDE family transposase